MEQNGHKNIAEIDVSFNTTPYYSYSQSITEGSQATLSYIFRYFNAKMWTEMLITKG